MVIHNMLLVMYDNLWHFAIICSNAFYSYDKLWQLIVIYNDVYGDVCLGCGSGLLRGDD